MRKPDRESKWGKAWDMSKYVAQQAQESLCVGVESSILAAWLLEVPWAHTAWDYHAVSIIHLRPSVGRPPCHKYYPEAEYELMVAAIDPTTSPDPDKGYFTYLKPISVLLQFHGIDDGFARVIVAAAVDHILAGNLSPDSDHFLIWQEAIHKTVLMRMAEVGIKPGARMVMN